MTDFSSEVCDGLITANQVTQTIVIAIAIPGLVTPLECIRRGPEAPMLDVYVAGIAVVPGGLLMADIWTIVLC